MKAVISRRDSTYTIEMIRPVRPEDVPYARRTAGIEFVGLQICLKTSKSKQNDAVEACERHHSYL